MRKQSFIIPEKLGTTYTYESYKLLISRLISEGKTSGPIQRDDLIYFTELNAKRMKRIEKTTVLTEELNEHI